MSADHHVTRLLFDWNNGDQTTLARLIPLLYEELRHMAESYLRGVGLLDFPEEPLEGVADGSLHNPPTQLAQLRAL